MLVKLYYGSDDNDDNDVSDDNDDYHGDYFCDDNDDDYKLR